MKILNLVKISLLAMLAALSVNAVANEQNTIESRLMPAGNVCVEGKECATAVVAVVEKVDTNSPEGLYTSKCSACHAAGVAGAPIVGDAGLWAPRIAKGIDVLYDSGLNGVPGTGMVARGGQSDLTDDQVKSIVDYMVEQSQ